METRFAWLLHTPNRLGGQQVRKQAAVEVSTWQDLREAEFCERKLRELWDRFAASNNTEESRSS